MACIDTMTSNANSIKHWIIDFGSIQNFTNDLEMLLAISIILEGSTKHSNFPNGKTTLIKYFGNCKWNDEAVLSDVLVVP